MFNLIKVKGQVAQKTKEHRLKVIGRWFKLTRKLLHISNLKSRKNIQQWKHFTICLIKQRDNRRLLVRYRTVKLFKKYIIFRMCLKQYRVFNKWKVITRKYKLMINTQEYFKVLKNYRRLTRNLILKQIKVKTIRIISNWSRIIKRVKKQERSFRNWTKLVVLVMKKHPTLFLVRYLNLNIKQLKENKAQAQNAQILQ